MKGAIIDLGSVIFSPVTACMSSFTEFGTNLGWALRYPIRPPVIISIHFGNKAKWRRMTYFLLRCSLCFSGVRSIYWHAHVSPAIFQFDSMCLHSEVWKVGCTNSSATLHPANKGTISLLGFKAWWQMHAWMCCSAQKCHNRYSVHETC